MHHRWKNVRSEARSHKRPRQLACDEPDCGKALRLDHHLAPIDGRDRPARRWFDFQGRVDLQEALSNSVKGWSRVGRHNRSLRSSEGP